MCQTTEVWTSTGHIGNFLCPSNATDLLLNQQLHLSKSTIRHRAIEMRLSSTKVVPDPPSILGFHTAIKTKHRAFQQDNAASHSAVSTKKFPFRFSLR
jgi:hypothetical protein